MSCRPEILALHICPICGADPDGGPNCAACGARRNAKGWVEGEQPAAVEEAVALLRSVVKMIPRQQSETPDQWLARVFDFTGHLHLLLEGET